MPLPPALAARLAKRGILKSANDSEPVEEVIAEDYDDHFETHPVANPAPGGTHTFISNTDRTAASGPAVNNSTESDQFDESDELVHEVPLCPNRFNPYHLCVEYCRHRWGCKRFQPDPNLVSKHERLLKRYPVPSSWFEVGDPETGRYYYWNTETDEVSWLPPQHPHAIIVAPADKPRADLVADDNQWDSQGESESEESTDIDDEIDDDRDFEEIEQDLKRKAQSARDRGKDHRRRRHDDSLDPMDPAAYSDVPRGTWSTGLEARESAKTGADVTAAGPLFQQRPYPSPGAVLRMNKTDSSSKK